jgi:hypothetical protein
MQRLRSVLVAAVGGLALACGGSSTSPDASGGAGAAGAGRTMTATFNGAAIKPNLLTSAYLGGQVAVNASDGPHNLAINANNVTAVGKYSVNSGNPNSAIAQWIDGSGQHSSLASGGGGTVTFTVLQLGRVAGSFDVVMKTTVIGSGTPSSVTLTGTFDIKFP